MYDVVKMPNVSGTLTLMHADLARSQEHRERFLRDVRLLADLHHPNLVQVTDCDALDEGTPFYVSERLVGRSLRDMLQASRAVDPHVAYSFAKQVLEALSVAHEREVPLVHGRITPEHLFVHVPPRGRPFLKVLGFGVHLGRQHGIDSVSQRYLAPEYLRGEAPTVASDVYGVGVVLYELLAGRGPFDHHREGLALIETLLHELPRSVTHYAPHVESGLAELLASALAKEPASRPRDARTFTARIDALSSARPGRARHDTVPDDVEATPRSTAQPVVLDYGLDDGTRDAGGHITPGDVAETESLLAGLEHDARDPEREEQTASRKWRRGVFARAPTAGTIAMALFAGAAAATILVLFMHRDAAFGVPATATGEPSQGVALPPLPSTGLGESAAVEAPRDAHDAGTRDGMRDAGRGAAFAPATAPR